MTTGSKEGDKEKIKLYNKVILKTLGRATAHRQNYFCYSVPISNDPKGNWEEMHYNTSGGEVEDTLLRISDEKIETKAGTKTYRWVNSIDV